MKLPKFKVNYDFKFNKETKKYETIEVEVELLTLHLKAGKMRVRTVDKIDNGFGLSRLVFDTDSDDFWKNYYIGKLTEW